MSLEHTQQARPAVSVTEGRLRTIERADAREQLDRERRHRHEVEERHARLSTIAAGSLAGQL